MKLLTFWFDVVSPYACLAFEHLPQALEGCSYAVDYRPVLFAGLLKHWGHKGPAEIAPKRAWTYTHVRWLAQRHGVELKIPSPHPFNPLALLRLGLACAPTGGLPSRYVVESLMRHAWRGAGDPNDPARLAALTARLAPVRDPAGDDVKAELRAHTDEALARGIFGVPTIEVEGERYWGFDALPMVREAFDPVPARQGA